MDPYIGAIALLITAATPLAAQWRVLKDASGGADSVVEFAGMPPGWHVTTGPGAVVYDPAIGARGRFAIESEIFLFPGTTQEGYGVFLGGGALDGSAPSYMAFVVRRDGSAAIERRAGGTVTALAAWSKNAAILEGVAGDAVKNVLRVSVEPDSVRFDVNGTRVATLPRGDLALDGLLGLRVGPATNLHIATLDVTLRQAPPRRQRSAAP